MNIKVVFGQVLKEIRTQKKVSQEKLALDSDLDRSYVSKLENGVYQPSLSTIFALAEVLEIEPEEIVAMVSKKLNS